MLKSGHEFNGGFMKKIMVVALVSACMSIMSFEAQAVPGDYSLRLKAGPSFKMADYENQVKIAGAFDYDLGFGWGVGLEALIGISNNFHFQLIPNVRFIFLYIGPAELYAFGGFGYEVFDTNSAFGMKFGSGFILPLSSKWEIITDLSLNITAAGTPGTPTTLDWLLGIGYRFGGGGEK
jgi:hypothetical protein